MERDQAVRAVFQDAAELVAIDAMHEVAIPGVHHRPAPRGPANALRRHELVDPVYFGERLEILQLLRVLCGGDANLPPAGAERMDLTRLQPLLDGVAIFSAIEPYVPNRDHFAFESASTTA